MLDGRCSGLIRCSGLGGRCSRIAIVVCVVWSVGVLQEERDFLWSGVRCAGVSIIRGDVWVVGVLQVVRDFLYNGVRCCRNPC